jgi:hypothetical protein
MPRSDASDPPDASSPSDESPSAAPWQQKLLGNIWLWAAAAILFWLLSYVVWGAVDLITVPGG